MINPLFDSLLGPHRNNSKTFMLVKGSQLTYSDFVGLSGQVANVLLQHGVEPGDRVALQADKSLNALALYAACVQVGAVFLPLNSAYTTNELAYFIGDAEPRVFVCSPERQLELVSSDSFDKRLIVLTMDAGGEGTLSQLAAEQSSDAPVAARQGNDLAALLYTSGTTGRSKGAMLTHDNLLSNAKALVECWQFTKDDVLLHALPIFHTHGLFVACNTILLSHASMIFQPRFVLEDVLEALPRSTTMMGVPTFYTRLLADERFQRDLTSHMRLFISGSAPLLEETHILFEERTGHRILERYGMTETTMSTSNPYEGDRKAGTVGLVLPDVEVRICDPETGKVLPQGEIGVLEVRGPNVFEGYWRMPEKTAEEFRDDGFFVTGDLSTIDAEGYVSIVGRGKDLIISGGLNIYPKEVELLLDEQPGVVESAVIGVPHPDFGEAVVGVLVLESGVDFDEAAMLTPISDKIARFKQPKKLAVVSELPRNSMGKVQKNQLRENYKSLFQADPA